MAPTVPCFVNPTAGRARAAARAMAADERLSVKECGVSDLAQRVRRATDGGAGRLIIVGGDGTIATAAEALVGTDHELAVIPAGTLDHFARGMGIPVDTRRAIEVALHGVARSVDVGFVNDRLILNTSSVGAYVRLVHTRELYERRLGYTLATIGAIARTLFRLRSRSMKVDIDGKAHSYRTPLIFVGIGERELRVPSLGERTDGGRPGLHVIITSAKSARRLLGAGLSAAILGISRAARSDGLDSFVVDRCIVDRPQRKHIHVAIDGETLRLDAPLEYRFEKAALRVVVPA